MKNFDTSLFEDAEAWEKFYRERAEKLGLKKACLVDYLYQNMYPERILASWMSVNEKTNGYESVPLRHLAIVKEYMEYISLKRKDDGDAPTD